MKSELVLPATPATIFSARVGFHETRCAVNPDAWREGVSHLEPSLRKKNVLIVGGGPAGMEAARISALIGHNVTLWEKTINSAVY